MIRPRLFDSSDFLLLHQSVLGSCGYGVRIYRTPPSWYAPDRVSGVIDPINMRRIDFERFRLDQRPVKRVDGKLVRTAPIEANTSRVLAARAIGDQGLVDDT